MENNTFSYSYSAIRNNEAESIRRKYMPHEESKMETLKRLDRRAQSAGIIEALCLGIIGALVFGVGVCFFLNVFEGAIWIAVTLMICGAFLMIPAYPMHRWISEKTKSDLTSEIIRLSEEIIKS